MLMEYLAHHGILGQKWGVRRYQNADGTWTDAGKKRYAKDIKRALQKQNSSEFRAIMKEKKAGVTSYGESAATAHLHMNQREIHNRMREEIRNSKESKALRKARDAFDEAEMDFLNNYGYDRTPNSKQEFAAAQKLSRAQDTYDKALSAYNKKTSEIWDKNYSDMMGAKLKDIGMEDTAVGREIVTGLLRNDGWYRETNVFDKGSSRVGIESQKSSDYGGIKFKK